MDLTSWWKSHTCLLLILVYDHSKNKQTNNKKTLYLCMYFSYARKDDSSRNWLVHVEHMTVKLFFHIQAGIPIFFLHFLFFSKISLIWKLLTWYASLGSLTWSSELDTPKWEQSNSDVEEIIRKGLKWSYHLLKLQCSADGLLTASYCLAVRCTLQGLYSGACICL